MVGTLDGLVARVAFWFISKQIVPYGRACHLCVPRGYAWSGSLNCWCGDGCIFVRHDGVANDSLVLVLGVSQGNSLASDRFVQGSLYPLLPQPYLREVLFPSIAIWNSVVND